jgi:diguanylate cyclase (GGDEF)-like protein
MPEASHDAGIRHLQLRLLELERERSQARDRADMLEGLYRAFTDIALTRSVAEIVDRTLRAAHEPLGFSRAIFFSIEPPRYVTTRRILDGREDVQACAEPAHAPAGSSLFRVAFSTDSTYDVGSSDDLTTPLVDCRGWYVVTRIERAGRVAGILYVDGHQLRTPSEAVTSLVPTLGAIAAVAIDNSILFANSQALAERDPLTGLFNRRAFGARVTAEIERCKREHTGLAYVLVDVDDFKSINDTRGHAFGDIVLTRLAQILTRCSRPQDVVGRFAGDEFVLLFTAIDVALACALVARLSNELRVGDLNCSIGAAIFPANGPTLERLFAAADRALYQTKANGKNGFSFA